LCGGQRQQDAGGEEQHHRGALEPGLDTRVELSAGAHDVPGDGRRNDAPAHEEHDQREQQHGLAQQRRR